MALRLKKNQRLKQLLDMLRRPSFLTVVFLLTFLASPGWTKGMKGILEREEHDFINNTIMPILIRNGICTKVKGDCNDGYIYCRSADSLSCGVYGISDEKAIKEILVAVLNSGLDISEFKFWRSKYHHTSLLEKPLLEYINRMGAK